MERYVKPEIEFVDFTSESIATTSVVPVDPDVPGSGD